MSTTERLEALGPRGEACIIIRTLAEPLEATAGPSATITAGTYRLATGERLKPTEDGVAFETLDGSRRFTLR